MSLSFAPWAAVTQAHPAARWYGTRERILKIFRITGLTKVFGIHEIVDQAIAAMKGRRQRNVSPGRRSNNRAVSTAMVSSFLDAAGRLGG